MSVFDNVFETKVLIAPKYHNGCQFDEADKLNFLDFLVLLAE